VLGPVVGDLLAQGISVYVIDDASTDGTADELAPLMGHGVIGVERFDGGDGFSWERLLTRKEALARDLDGDWFLHTDADELRESPWANRNLAEAVAAVDGLGYDAIDFKVFNFPPTSNGFHKGTDLRSFFRYWEPAKSFDQVQIKCWKKSAEIDLASTGGHHARFPWQRVFPVRFILRHYPIRSQEHGERKVFRERKVRFLDDERRRGWHVQYDGLEEGHSFLRDPKTLRVFDPEAARYHVWLNHRGKEILEEKLRESAAAIEAERREIADLRAALAAERHARELLVQERDDARAELQRALAMTHDALGKIDELLGSRSWRWSSPARVAWKLTGGK
jgi:hypothetical protein